MTATASNITATRIDVTAAFFIAHLVLETITRTIIPKRLFRAENARLVEGEKYEIRRRIEL